MKNSKELNLAANEGEPDLANGSVFFVGTATVILRFAGIRSSMKTSRKFRSDFRELISRCCIWAAREFWA